MINTHLETAFNQQLTAEAHSAYLYLAMAAWLEKQKLPGFAHWMVMQSQEELCHAMLFYRYIIDNNGTVLLGGMAPPPASWQSLLDCMQNVLSHEQMVTRMINNLVSLAKSENDKKAEKFLQWFVDEQKEEEENAQALVDKALAVSGSSVNLGLADKELAGRGFSMPAILRL